MRDQTLMYWGMVVTMFLLIAAMITARDVFESYVEKRRAEHGEEYPEQASSGKSGRRPEKP